MKRRIRALLTAAAALALGATNAAAAGAYAAPARSVPQTYHRYVALGDSYTAGPLIPTTDPAGGCFRSDHNYPSQLAQRLQVQAFVDVSCSGAKTDDMTGSQQTSLGPVAPQFDALTPDTDLVTVSIGGNDEAVFGTLVGYCPLLRAKDPVGSPCRDEMRTDPGGDRLILAGGRTRERVTRVIAQIRQRSPQAKIVAVGYPAIIPPRGTCIDRLPLADGDYRYARQVNQRLTDAINLAARTNAVDYADVWTASSGHDICSADPWINGQVTDSARAQNFHPFLNEQTAIAGLVAGLLSR